MIGRLIEGLSCVAKADSQVGDGLCVELNLLIRIIAAGWWRPASIFRRPSGPETDAHFLFPHRDAFGECPE